MRSMVVGAAATTSKRNWLQTRFPQLRTVSSTSPSAETRLISSG
jgi:hypothetical protein